MKSAKGRLGSIFAGLLVHLPIFTLLVAFVVTGLTLTTYTDVFDSEFYRNLNGCVGHVPAIVRGFVDSYSFSLGGDLYFVGAMAVANIFLGAMFTWVLYSLKGRPAAEGYAMVVFTVGWVTVLLQWGTAIVVFISLVTQPMGV
jgi:hypothetical protein